VVAGLAAAATIAAVAVIVGVGATMLPGGRWSRPLVGEASGLERARLAAAEAFLTRQRQIL